MAGLDFLGPVGITPTDAFHCDPYAVVQAPEALGGHGPLREFQRGATEHLRGALHVNGDPPRRFDVLQFLTLPFLNQ